MIKLKISPTLNGPEYADNLSDRLSGVYYGRVKNGGYAPVSNQELNKGYKPLFITHNAERKIENAYLYVSPLSGLYQGDRNAWEDFNNLSKIGKNSDPLAPNNEDGKYGGLAFEFDAQSNENNHFTNSDTCKIVGKHGGTSVEDAFIIHKKSAIDDPEAVDGIINPGKSALVKSRIYMPESTTIGGKMLWDLNLIFTYEV